MAIRTVAGLTPSESVAPMLQREDHYGTAASVWKPIGVVQEACIVRSCVIVPQIALSASATDYWMARLAVSRLNEDHPVTIPPGTDEIVSRPLNGGVNNWVVQQPWDFGSQTWTEAQANLLPGDVLGVFWEKIGAPSNLPGQHFYSARITPVAVA